MSSKALHSGHRERLRKRFLETGTDGFQEHELLELLLFYALPRVNTNEISHRLIQKFGSISAVLDADKKELASVKGISESGAALIKLMCDLSRSYALSGHSSVKFSSLEELEQYVAGYFSDTDSEICLILSLDMQMCLSGTLTFPADELCGGTVTPRNIAEKALRSSLHRIAVGLNHPGKPPFPSENDYKVMRLFAETLTPLGVEICDCIICGCGKTFSMRRSGAFSFAEGAAFLK